MKSYGRVPIFEWVGEPIRVSGRVDAVKTGRLVIAQ